ncbi:ABC transporter permease [Oleidesulfovibrio sp.]|uniref:ABC transporter permease n=1 Tax=Oleidesulfovibrio sp. TaxID=2909707 RepID=UPI003A8AB73E
MSLPYGHAGLGATLLRLAPVLVPCSLLFTGGFALTLAQSLGYMLPVPSGGQGTFAAYKLLLQSYYLASFLLSMKVAFLSALFSIVFGAVLAVGVWRLPHRLQQAAVVYKVPLILPHVAVALLCMIFWARSGLVSSFAWQLGLIDAQQDFPAVLYGGSGMGMVLAYVYKEVPFVILMSYAALKRLDPRLLDTASMLGAGRWQTWRSVILPHLAPTLHPTFIILFLFSFGGFEVPYLLGESNPGMLSVEIYNLFFQRSLSYRPQAMAVLTVMFLFSLVFVGLYSRLVRRLGVGERKL